MGQTIGTADGPTRQVIMVLGCDACPKHWGLYIGGDYIKMRGQSYADGWRRKYNKWFFGPCVPEGKENDAET